MRNKKQILRGDQTTCEEMIYTALGEMVAGWSTS